MSKIASLTLLVVGSGWMNQTISMQRSVELLRPLESAAEANDFADAIRAELLKRPQVEPIDGLLLEAIDFGDFAAVTDVRLTYTTREYRDYEFGFFGSQDQIITTSEQIADFRNDDSFGVVSDEED